MPTVSLEEARDVHSRMVIVDGHNDTPVERVGRGERPLGWMDRDPAYHTDIPRMREGNYTSAFFIVGNGAVANVWVSAERVIEQIEAHPDALRLATASADILAAKETGQVAVILSVEGIGRWLDGHADILRMLHRLGVRLAGITHGEGGDEPTQLQGSRSPFGPCEPQDRERERREAVGLTDFGKEILQESNQLGLVTDLAHINDRAFYDVLERSSLSPIMSHTAVFSLCPHWRCLTDDQIRALADVGGVLGVAFAPMFIHPETPTVDRVVDHILYAADLVGIDHVGIGTDFDGLGDRTPVIPEVSRLAELTHAMLSRGMSEADIAKVWGGNFMRVLSHTIDLERPA